jgi:hypothetical protein
LEVLGAPVTAVGLFGTCQDLLDGVYQHPGGWIGDRYGRRRALMLFVGLAMLGYALLLVGTALAVRLCRARARHGLVEHGQPYPVRIPIVVAPMLLGPQPRNHASRAYRRSALERDPGAAVLDGRRDRYRRRARIHICR